MAYSRCLIMKNKPRIRFKGFTEDWEQCKVNDLFKITRGQVLATSLTTPEKTSENIYPVYSSQTKNNGLMGYYSEYLFEDAITWTTDGANAGTVNFRPGRFYSTNVNGVLINENGYSCYAVSEIINKVAYKYVSKVGNPKLMNNVMAEIDIIITADIDELGRISALIEAYNQYITLHQRKLEKLKLAKKALLQKLFPKNGSQFPELRFKGFTEAWEQRKLSDVLKVNSGKDYKHLDQGNIPVYGTGGYMLSVNESLSNIDAIGIGRKGTIDKPQYLKAPFWTVDTLFYLTALDKHSILFLYYLMQLIPWKKFDESTGVPSLSKNTIDNISSCVPSNSKEEALISALFNQLDKSITLHQRKLDKLQEVKKGLLQKMFV